MTFARPVQRVLLVDDHELYRDGVSAMLGADGGLEIVGGASTARDCLELATRLLFDLAIVDVTLPDRPGAALTRDLRRLRPRCRILALSMVDTPYTVVEHLRAGATGYALKSQPTEELRTAVEIVGRGGRYLAPTLQREQIDAMLSGRVTGPIDRLSTREREVFDLLLRASSNDRIANALCIGLRTVEAHRRNIMAKLGTHSIAELFRFAARNHLLDDA